MALKKKIVFISLAVISFIACRKDQQIIDTKDYPADIGKIIRGKCAVSGCHNDASYQGAAGLNLATWESLFKGTTIGAAVIPYRPDYSSLCYFTNSYPDLGIINLPTMPVNGDPLNREDVKKLMDWITSGAPNADGKIAYADNPNRRKFYVAHTACKVVAVFDAETQEPMRFINVLKDNENWAPHTVKVSPDGKYWYVCFTNGGTVLRRYNTSDDSFAGEIYLGSAEWNSFTFTPDSKKAFVVDWSADGKLATVDLANMKVTDTTKYGFYPHGSCVSPDGQYVYFTATTGNFLYKMTIATGSMDFIPINSNDVPGQPSSLYNAHEIVFSADGSNYYVTCQNEGTVRVYDAATDNNIAVIPIGGSALEMSLAPSKNLLFVTSWDANIFSDNVGVVAVINTQTNALHSTPYVDVGTQPHGIMVDEKLGLVYVANRNIDVSGPLPHHTSVCGGRNGSIVFIDLSTLQLTGRKIEVGVDPYYIGLRE